MFLVIDDLCFYANKEQIRQLEAAGGFAIRNNPTRQFLKHFWHPSKFFQRNHQKVMLVDDSLFCGSLNLANCYTSVRYGDGSFRDMNIILKKHPTKRVRDFFRDMIIRNEVFFPGKIKPDEINKVFDEIDMKYAWQEAEEPFKDGWPPETKTSASGKSTPGLANMGKWNDQEVSLFLEETPPHKVDVSRAVLEMIKKAEKNIKIIQPYVTNVDEIEDLLIEASRDRGIEVEIVTARIRDQPVYRTFLNSDLFSRLFKESPNIKIYEEPYKYLHMKAVVIDDGRYMTLGSLNQDTWSFYCNNEANVLLVNEQAKDKPDTLAYLTFMKVFNNLKRECRLVDQEERYTPMGKLENMWWRLFLACSYLVARNR